MTKPDIKDVVLLYRELVAGWNRRDARGMAALYGSKGVQVGFDGTVVQTPAAILDHLEPIFRDHPTASYIPLVREARMVGTEVAMLRAVVGMIQPGTHAVMAKRNAIQIVIASMGDGEWKIELFQNTPLTLDDDPEGLAALTNELQDIADKSAPASG